MPLSHLLYLCMHNHMDIIRLTSQSHLYESCYVMSVMKSMSILICVKSGFLKVQVHI